MDYKNNVINIRDRRQKKVKTDKSTSSDVSKKSTKSTQASVVDFTEKRQEALQRERRAVRRTILTEFVGVFVVVPKLGLQKVNLYDVSENGLAFDFPALEGKFKVGEEVAMRVYLSQKNYFPFIVKINNLRSIFDEGVSRHGASFVKNTVNDEALKYFVKFIECVSISAQLDLGDMLAPASRR